VKRAKRDGLDAFVLMEPQQQTLLISSNCREIKEKMMIAMALINALLFVGPLRLW